MRSAIRKAAVNQFAVEIGRRLPQFARGKEFAFPTWELRLAADLAFFVRLQPHSRHDEFMMEIGWSDDGKYPITRTTDPDPSLKKWQRRLSRLWERGTSEPVWEVVPKLSDAEENARINAFNAGETDDLDLAPKPPIEEVLPRVPQLILDAVAKTEEYAIPLFRRVAEARGYMWPSGNEKK